MIGLFKPILGLPPREFFLFYARMAFGGWLLYVGAMKWIGGAGGFVGYIGSQFAETWVPMPLVAGLGWFIIIAEPLFGLWLLSGKTPRLAWAATADLMFVLMMGQTILKQFPTVANNWQYVVFAAACAALSSPSCCATGCASKDTEEN